MRQKTKDRTIAGALIGAAATILASIIALSAGSSPDPPDPPSPTWEATRGGGGSGTDTNNGTDTGNGDIPSECYELGPNLVGGLCLTPPTSSPGDPYEVSGFNLPPHTQFILNDYESSPQGVVTDDAGTFSATFETDPMECKTYMITLSDENGMPISNVLHKQPDC